MSKQLFAHQTQANPLCSRHVYVCPLCGWWKPEPFTCRHMVEASDGDLAYRDYRGERCRFYLDGEARTLAEASTESGDPHV